MEDQNQSETSTEANQEENPKPAYDIETYQHAIEEARRTLDQQLEAFNDVNEKAWRIVRLNGIIATVYIAAIANALDGLRFTATPTVLITLGLLLLGISVYLATEGQEAQKVMIGQSDEAFESLRKNDPSEIAYLYKTLEDYEDWISTVHEKTERNGKTVNTAKRISLIGVIFLLCGTLSAIIL